MKLKTTVEFTKKDIETALKEHLENSGYKVYSISVDGHSDVDDRSGMRFTEVSAKAVVTRDE